MLESSALHAEASTTEEPESGKTARPGLCGGCRVTGIPTAENEIR